MNNKMLTISYVVPDSPADIANITAGDILLSVNDTVPEDILEYRFLVAEYEIVLKIEKKNGDIEIITIENDYEDPGLEFENSLLCDAKSCNNKCVFCFIDQLPKGMRETVYFKDDDVRLSFLQGNYVTLTNVSSKELDRLINLRISPLNISVHTTNPNLRVKMLNNRFAGDILERMKKLKDAGIFMNCQIVLCPGYNDGAELDKTISDLAKLSPYVNSVSVVPVGLTSHRDGLADLKTFDKESCKKVLDQIHAHQKRLLKEHSTRFVFASDEFYINAGANIPDASFYEGFPQIENGVGMMASLKEEFDEAIKYIKPKKYKKKVIIVTGELCSGFIKSLAEKVEAAAKGIKIDVVPVKNKFFGGGVNVAGLVCACDILDTLTDVSSYDYMLIPSSMLKDSDDVFLDNVSLEELKNKLSIDIIPVENDGYAFVESIIGEQVL